MIPFEEAKRLLKEHLGDASDLVIQTLGGKSQIRVSLGERKIIFSNSRDAVHEVDREQWEIVYQRREELPENLKNKASQYAVPGWKKFPLDLNVIITPYIPALMLFLEKPENFIKERIDYKPDKPDSRIEQGILKQDKIIDFAVNYVKEGSHESIESGKDNLPQAEFKSSNNFITSKKKNILYLIGILLVILLIILPFFIRDEILFFLGIDTIQDYYEILSSIISGVSLIIAFVTITDQKIDLARQNLRQNYSTQVEAVNQIINGKRLLNGLHDKKLTEQELMELEYLIKLLYDKSTYIINHSLNIDNND